MEKVARRISDRSLLKLIRQMLKTPIAEFNGKGTLKVLPNRAGTPQGAVCSPLLANIYLNDFSLTIHRKTPCRIVTYADDMVVLHKRPYTQEQFNWIEKQLQDDQLTLNHQKTRSVNMSCLGSEFDFLGFRFKRIKGLMWLHFGGHSTSNKIDFIYYEVLP
jgi:retron-type reverse transcriptase